MIENIYYIFQREDGETIFEYISLSPPPDIGEVLRLRDHRNLVDIHVAEFEVIDLEEHQESGQTVIRVIVQPLE